MSEHHFGVYKPRRTIKHGKRAQTRVVPATIPANVVKRINAIAERHGASFTTATIPGTGYQVWFSCPNRGHPFDDATARAVLADVVREDLFHYLFKED